MATSTAIFQFRKPGGSDFIDEGLDLNNNWDKAEAALIDLRPTYLIRKTSNEAVTSSTTLQDDDQLKFSVVSGKTYIFEFNIQVIAGSDSPDLKWAFNSTATGTMDIIAIGPPGSVAAGNPQMADVATYLLQGVSSFPTTATAMGLTTVALPLIIKGLFTATSSGEIRFQWAQNGSNASACTVLAGSWVQYTRMTL